MAEWLRCEVAQLIRQSGNSIDTAEFYQQTGGNPFYVTEAISADTDRVPPSVRDAVLARAARLSQAGQAVLAVASVIGLHCEVPLLVAISGRSADALDECVEARGLLDAGDEVTFRHELARQAIDESLPSATRVALHREVLGYLKRRCPTSAI